MVVTTALLDVLEGTTESSTHEGTSCMEPSTTEKEGKVAVLQASGALGEKDASSDLMHSSPPRRPSMESSSSDEQQFLVLAVASESNNRGNSRLRLPEADARITATDIVVVS